MYCNINFYLYQKSVSASPGNVRENEKVSGKSGKMIQCQGNFSLPFHAFFVKNASGTLTLKMIKDSQSILYLIVRNLSEKNSTNCTILQECVCKLKLKLRMFKLTIDLSTGGYSVQFGGFLSQRPHFCPIFYNFDIAAKLLSRNCFILMSSNF